MPFIKDPQLKFLAVKLLPQSEHLPVKQKQFGINWHFPILYSSWPIDHLLPITGELQEILLYFFLILQSLTLLFPRKREIRDVSRDIEGLLKAHASHWEWSFALDTESELKRHLSSNGAC
jgi:hypothetical protein